jgi:hypothetical protein
MRRLGPGRLTRRRDLTHPSPARPGRLRAAVPVALPDSRGRRWRRWRRRAARCELVVIPGHACPHAVWAVGELEIVL